MQLTASVFLLPWGRAPSLGIFRDDLVRYASDYEGAQNLDS